MSFFEGGGDAEGQMEKMAEMFGPGQVDQMMRQALQFCWLSLPKDRRNVPEWERQARRVFERAIQNLRDDADQFASPAGG